jgi:hypothetical protein
MLEPLAFDEYCRFDTSAFYQNGNIHRKLKVPTSEREGKLSNPRGHPARERCMIFFPKIYEIPRTHAARELCVDFAAAKNTVSMVEKKRTLEEQSAPVMCYRRGLLSTHSAIEPPYKSVSFVSGL